MMQFVGFIALTIVFGAVAMVATLFVAQRRGFLGANPFAARSAERAASGFGATSLSKAQTRPSAPERGKTQQGGSVAAHDYEFALAIAETFANASDAARSDSAPRQVLWMRPLEANSAGIQRHSAVMVAAYTSAMRELDVKYQSPAAIYKQWRQVAQFVPDGLIPRNGWMIRAMASATIDVKSAGELTAGTFGDSTNIEFTRATQVRQREAGRQVTSWSALPSQAGA